MARHGAVTKAQIGNDGYMVQETGNDDEEQTDAKMCGVPRDGTRCVDEGEGNARENACDSGVGSSIVKVSPWRWMLEAEQVSGRKGSGEAESQMLYLSKGA